MKTSSSAHRARPGGLLDYPADPVHAELNEVAGGGCDQICDQNPMIRADLDLAAKA